MREIGRRVFSGADQAAFAALSGDRNPLHLEPEVARRTIFGRCVAHGVHQALWALEAWLAGGDEGRALVSLEAKFLHAVGIDEAVRCVVAEESVLEIFAGARVAARVRVRWEKNPAADMAIPPSGAERACRVWPIEEMAGANGELEIFCDPVCAREMFPALAARLPASQLAALLATTRLVGMECPGWHSIFSSLQLRFAAARGEPRLRWRVERAATHLGLVQLAVEGPGVTGSLQALLRPAPVAQASAVEVAWRVRRGEFAGQRALIIGGSRGLGEVTAKIVAAGGGAVCVTYWRGAADAERVCAELRGIGCDASARRFEVVADELPELPWTPTHLYYFATPQITIERATAFSPGKFAVFCACHVEGFARTLLAVLARGGEMLTVFYPSTIFLDEPAPGVAEYCAAKAAGEALGRQLAQRFPALRFYAPRLPRMTTDQTAGLVAVPAADPLATLLAALRALDAA